MNATAEVVAPYSMSDEIYVGGARHLPARDIARAHGYVRDYVARLCRQGKVAREPPSGRFQSVGRHSIDAIPGRLETGMAQ